MNVSLEIGEEMKKTMGCGKQKLYTALLCFALYFFILPARISVIALLTGAGYS